MLLAPSLISKVVLPNTEQNDGSSSTLQSESYMHTVSTLQGESCSLRADKSVLH